MAMRSTLRPGQLGSAKDQGRLGDMVIADAGGKTGSALPIWRGSCAGSPPTSSIKKQPRVLVAAVRQPEAKQNKWRCRRCPGVLRRAVYLVVDLSTPGGRTIRLQMD
jgi:hypothetical protein